MKRSELIKELASRTDITQTKAKDIINTFTDIITSELSSGKEVKVDGLGCFHTVLYNSHNIKAVNGIDMKLEPRLSPRFNPSRKLKEAVRKER